MNWSGCANTPAVAVDLEVAGMGDLVEPRSIPGSAIRAGHGWIRSFDGKRSVQVAECECHGWTVRAIEKVEEP